MKKLVCYIVCLLCIYTCGFYAVASETETEVQGVAWGDLNFDGSVNAMDALMILTYSVGKFELTSEQIAVADVSYHYCKTEEHLGIDAKDALLVLQYSASTGPFKMTFPQGK